MKSSKLPVIILAVVLLVLIAVPLVIFFAPVGNGGRESVPALPVSYGGAIAATSNDVDALLAQAGALVDERMQAAVRNGKFGLDRLQRYLGELDRSRDLIRRGRVDTGRERLQRLIEEGEAELNALEARESALTMAESLARRLRDMAHLEPQFATTFAEARRLYEQAQRSLQAGHWQQAMDAFDAASNRLDALEEAAGAEIQSWLTQGRQALDAWQINRAREAFEKVLALEPEQADALAGLAAAKALAALEQQLDAVNDLQQAGKLEEALAQVDSLLEQQPENVQLRSRQEQLRQAIRERDFAAAMEAAHTAGEAGDLDERIAALERALDIKQDPKTLELLREAVAEREKRMLETLLSDAFNALRNASYSDARDLYREALALKPDSAEAKEGLERSARLLIAEIEFRENLASAQRLASDGRYPMAASFFNRAMATRPANLPEADAERSLRTTLERQSKQVTVTLRSDNQTHVSIVGVLPPERFRSKELSLYPDVYRLRGTRRGQPDVEIELRVSVDDGPVSVTVIVNGQ